MARKRTKDAGGEPQIPDISDDFLKFSALNPEYDFPMSERAERDYKSLFLDKDGKELPIRTIIRNVELFRIRIQAIVPQLEGNQQWMRILGSVKRIREKLDNDCDPAHHDRVQALMHRQGGLILAVASTEEAYKASPRTMEKTVQDIFSNDTEKLFVERPGTPDGHWDLSRTSVAPNKINNKKLENLGLNEHIPPKGTKRIAREQAYARAIPAIKEMLSDLEPLVLYDSRDKAKVREFRLLRIGKGVNKGYVLGTQNISGKKILFKTDLHGAYRRVNHILENYRNEFRALSDIQQQIADIDDCINNESIKDDAERKRIEEIFMGLFARLRYVTDADKVNMKKKLEKCTSLKSERHYPQKNKTNPDGTVTVVRPAYSRTVINLPEKRTIWASIKSDIAKRKQRVEKIGTWLHKDGVKLDDHVLAQQAPFKKFYSMIEQLENDASAQEGKGLHIFRVNKPLDQKTSARLLNNLGALKKQFNKGKEWFEPYGAFAEKMVAHIDATIEQLGKIKTTERGSTQAVMDEKDMEYRKSAAHEFLNIYLAAKVEKFYVEYQGVLEKNLAVSGQPDFGRTIAALDDLEKNTKQKMVKANLDTTEYYRVFAEIYHLLNGLKKRCREAMAITGTDPESIKLRKKKIKELRARARNFRFDRLVKSDGAEY